VLLVAEDDCPNGDGADGLRHAEVDSGVAPVVLADVGHGVAVVVDLEAAGRSEGGDSGGGVG
jgi:hypothetical protein